MVNFSKTTLLIILLVIFLLAAGFFAYQWWQIKGELARQIEQNENLKNQIAELQKEIEKLKISQPGEITITTDKTEYKQGEIIKITIRNNSDKPIFSRMNMFITWNDLHLEKFKNGSWVEVDFWPPVFGHKGPCFGVLLPERPLGVNKLESHSEFVQEWNQRECHNIGEEPTLIEKGKYRLAFVYGTKAGNWAYDPKYYHYPIKNPKLIYSNEFIIK